VKKINLSKELLLNGVLIGVLSIGLVSCGGGGGGGSGSTSLSPGGSGPSTPLSYSLATYLYADTDQYSFNKPIITVYIDGKPVKLVADTGTSGLIVNSSAVNIPSSDYTSYTFSFGPSGTVASATVCLNPSITNSCAVMLIGVVEPGTFFSTTGEAQGDFGLASGLNSTDIAYHLSDSTGLSYPTYLERQYGINSYTISFYPLSNGYYSNVSSTTPIGWISFGVYNGNSNTLIPYTMNSSGMPITTVIFSSSTASFTDYASFDSGNNYNYLYISALQTEIPNFSQSADENACANYTNYGFLNGTVNGGFVISYSLQNNSGSFQTESFTTEPSSSFCQAGIPFNLMEGVTYGYGYEYGDEGETFGLPAMLGHTFTWVLNNNGFVQAIGISP
jgi:hypothetical protein